jgi:pheromone shutdown-related protein TraB
MRYKNLILIGTSHIAAESVAKVEQTIVQEHPAVVAIELDRKRLYALLHPSKAKASWRDIRRVGFKGYLFSMLGAWAERKLGEKVNMKPGAEMLQAIKAAKKVNARLALIDQDIEVTLKRFSKELTWKEKFRMVGDVLKGMVSKKSAYAFDLSKVPEEKLIGKMIAEVKQRYPNIYKVLVTERNQVMAHNLTHLMLDVPGTIVAVVGAGHGKEMLQLIKAHLNEHEKRAA